MNEIRPPMVSVYMITYNHEKYIAQAIEGILMQKVNFDYEIVLGEDCSTDNTREIVKVFALNNPNKIKLILQENNVGYIANSQCVYKACTGKYIAICEGDDYWIDPLKLQKEVDFMELNLECGMVHTAFNVLNVDKVEAGRKNYNKHGSLFEELLLVNTVSTLTVLCRRSVMMETIKNIGETIKQNDWLLDDYPLWLDIGLKHKIGFIDDITGIYRILTESACHTKNTKKAYLIDKSTVDIQVYFFKKYLKSNKPVSVNFRYRFKERIFHARKRMLLDYKWIAKEQIWKLLKTNPIFYFYLIGSKLKRIV